MLLPDYLARYPILDSFSEDLKHRILVSFRLLSVFIDGDDESYHSILRNHNTLSRETFKNLSRAFTIFRMNPNLRSQLELYLILWNYAGSRQGQKVLRGLPKEVRDVTGTSKIASAILKSGYLSDKLNLSLDTYAVLKNLFEHGYDACRLLSGEAPPSITEESCRHLDSFEQKILLARSVLNIATDGYLYSDDDTIGLSEEAADNICLLFFYSDKPYLGLNFYEVQAKRIQHKGFNRKISMAAGRLGLMLGLSSEGCIYTASYLVRTFPAYESLISELSTMGENKAGPKFPLFPIGASQFFTNCRLWQLQNGAKDPLQATLESSLPVFQHRLVEVRLSLGREYQDQLDLGIQPKNPPEFYEIDFSVEAELAKNGPLSIHLS
ncbi:hypothetical protein IJF85_00880 [Candidatus Saccharibacteria bacterium]|nr:hypothetical protein [Candidatus Saccharibacteria bacterium]MBQ3264057.1 hypothetical protein [Candidatus Saccharibacteria bacterium]